MKPQKSVIRSALFSVAGFVLGAGTAQNVFANPGGATVVHGSAQFATPGANTLEITNSANAIINWQSFGIGQGETTRFIQPSADSAVLNRVTGSNVSGLLGNLSSNGRVFLINPHGIVVGENAVINVAGFVASTLNISDQDFLNGRFDFQGENAGALINRGLVTAGPGGEIVFIAPQIENHGVLSVDNGALLLAAGEKVKLTRFDLNGIEFDVQAPDDRVLNLGELIARRGAVGVFAGSIDQQGIVDANAVGVDAAGNIVLQAQNAVTVADGARVSASGADGGDIRIQTLSGDTLVRGDVGAVGSGGKGGSIRILGERVGLFGDAAVDASGMTGGQVLIGGDYQGKGEVQTAQQTQLGVNAEIHADAIENGNGGKVIVWADGFTEAYGLVTARGGAVAGNGGFAEISGKDNLVFRGVVDAGATNGDAGTVLFDPQDITITASGPDPIATNDQFAENPSTSVTFSDTGVSALLGTQNVLLQANNDIFISGGVTSSSNNSLTLMAGRSIIASTGPFTVDTNGGDFTAIANATSADGVVTADRSTGPANISLISGNGFFINTNGGNILLEIRDGAGRTGTQATMGIITIGTGLGSDGIASGGGSITLRADNGLSLLTGGNVNAGTGSITIAPYSIGATIDVGSAVTGDQLIDSSILSNIVANDLIIGGANAGDITFLGALTPSPTNIASSFEFQTGGNIVFDQGAQTALSLSGYTNGTVTLDAGGAILDNTSGIADVFAGLTTGQLNLLAQNGIHIGADVNLLSYQNTVSGDIDIIDNFSGALTLLTSSNSSGGTTTIDQTNGAGGLIVAGDISQSSGLLTLKASGTGQTFKQNTGNITNNGDIAIVADNIDISSGSIDASPGGTTFLKPVDNTTTWVIGGITATDLTETELNRVMNNIAIGGPSLTLAGVDVTGTLTFSNNQNLTIETPGAIQFLQAGSGIATTGLVHLIADKIANGAVGSDVGANQLIIDTANGIGSVAVPLETRISELVATNTASGEIGVSNAVTNLLISAPGVQNQGTGTNISILNNAGSIQVDGLIDSSSGTVALRTTGAGADIVATTDIVAASDIALATGRDLVIHAGPGPTTQARVRAGGTLNLGAGRNLALISDTAANTAAIVSNGTSLGTQNGIELETGDTLTVAGTTSAGLLNMSGGSATFNGATSLTGLSMTGGTLGGSGNVNVSGATTWSGGSMGGTGATTANGGLNINGAVTLNRTLSNSGTGTWQGTGDIGGTGTFNNLGSASLAITNNQSMMVTFNNGGNVTKSSTGTTQFSAYTHNGGVLTLAGTVNINAFNLGGGTLNGGGAVNVATGFNWTGGIMGGTGTTVTNGSLLINGPVVLDRTLNNNGSGVWQGANSIGGTGTFNNTGLAALDITNNQSIGATFNNAGTVNKTSTGTTTFTTFNQTGGTTTSAGPITVDTLNLSGGLIDGSSNIGVGTAFNWTGGGMGGTGTLTVNDGLTINGAVSLDRTLNNTGNATWQGTGDITGGGTFNNGANGVLTIANDQVMGPVFNNAGTVDKTGTGITSFAGGYRQAAGITRLNGGTLQLSAGEFLLSGGVLTGNGTVTAPVFNNAGGWIAPGGYIDPVSQAPTSPDLYGLLTIDGDLQMGGSARINFDLGISNERGGIAGTDFDLLKVTGNAQLDGTLVLVADPSSFNAFIGEGFRPVITYATRSGAFSSVGSFPVGYEFSREVLTQGLGLKVTAVPLRTTDFISDDELEGLRDAFRENISRIKLERQRRRKEDEEEEKRRRAMMCS